MELKECYIFYTRDDSNYPDILIDMVRAEDFIDGITKVRARERKLDHEITIYEVRFDGKIYKRED